MNEELIDDLKQFIASTVHQTEVRLDQKISGVEERLHQEMAEGFAGVGEAIDQIHEQLAERDKEVDKRLIRLERKVFAA